MGALRNPATADPAESPLYESDFHEWSLQMADALRKRDTAGLDWEHLAEELEGLAIRDRRELFSRVKVLLLHLLKWKTQHLERSKSWRLTILNQREEIRELLEQSPSLSRLVNDSIERQYPRAVEKAVAEMGLLQNPFPAKCPFNAEQLLSDEYWPE